MKNIFCLILKISMWIRNFHHRRICLHLLNVGSVDENKIRQILRFKDMVNKEYIDNLF